jgi:DNA-binding response OmpR family regulator
MNRRVLIVDDYPGLIELYELALGARGFEVLGAATASEALASAASQELDAVVVDLELPDGSGAVLARRLREMPFASRPIVGISGFAPGPVVGGTFDEFLHKPVHPKRLASVLRRLLERDRERLSA